MTYSTLAEALAAMPSDTDSVFVHRGQCNRDPCTCKPFKVPYSELVEIGPERAAQMLGPLVEGES